MTAPAASLFAAGPRPRLLVSVRSVAEAEAASAGGADILDVKEPDRGPLGRAEAAVVAAVADFAATVGVPATAAWGEWRDRHAAPPPPLSLGLLKYGLAGCRATAAGGIAHGAQESAVPVIPVYYADEALAESPTWSAVLDLARAWGAPGVLIDTFAKSAGTVWDWLSEGVLAERIAAARGLGLGVALAGSVNLAHANHCSAWRRLCEQPTTTPAVLAVRGAACRGSDRRLPIDPAAVRALREALAPGDS